jgi:uncharacterized protein
MIASNGIQGVGEREMNRKIDPKLLEILVCPLTKSTLRYDAEREELISDKARLAYPIHDGIPIMLPDEARPLDEDETDDADEVSAIQGGAIQEGAIQEGVSEKEAGEEGSGKGGAV